MTPTTLPPAAPLPTVAPALAAWESATIRNLDPLLRPDDSRALWDAIVAHRTDGDATAFAASARAIVASAGQATRTTTERAIDALVALLARAPSVAPVAPDAPVAPVAPPLAVSSVSTTAAHAAKE